MQPLEIPLPSARPRCTPKVPSRHAGYLRKVEKKARRKVQPRKAGIVIAALSRARSHGAGANAIRSGSNQDQLSALKKPRRHSDEFDGDMLKTLMKALTGEVKVGSDAGETTDETIKTMIKAVAGGDGVNAGKKDSNDDKLMTLINAITADDGLDAGSDEVSDNMLVRLFKAGLQEDRVTTGSANAIDDRYKDLIEACADDSGIVTGRSDYDPVNFLSHRPFTELDLKIDDHPIRIIDHEAFNEASDVHSIFAADAVALVLWRWHPDSLRAFLDRGKFHDCTWTRTEATGPSEYETIKYERKDRTVTISSTTSDERCQLSLDTPENQPWEFLYGSMNHLRFEKDDDFLPAMSSSFAMRAAVDRYWETGGKVKHEFTVSLSEMGGGVGRKLSKAESDPHKLYHSCDGLSCDRCGTVSTSQIALRRCTRCYRIWYCSGGCQKEDWTAHKPYCSKQSPAS